MVWITDRLKEKSTWVGLAALLGMFGLQIDDTTMAMISQLAITASGLVAVFMKEA